VPNATYTFHPGTYILVGGGLSTQSSNSHITNVGGTTFYNTFGSCSAKIESGGRRQLNFPI
jgi:hypothetical protein